MNYIKLINAFYDRLETNSLSASAIALWHALVHINNKAGWQREFSVAASVLCVKTGLSERTITNARNDLKIKGFIDFKSRKGNKSAIYILVDLSANISDKSSDKYSLSANIADSVSNNVSCNTSDSVSDNVSALNKLNKTKQNNKEDANNTRVNPFAFYEQERFGFLSGYTSERIGYLIDEYGEENVLAAMQEAVIYEKRNLKYVEAILVNPNKKRGESGGATIHKYPTGVSRSSSKSAEQAIREAEEARRAWGG